MAGGRYVLLYDADCALCTWLRNWTHRLGGLRVRSIPLASPDADPYLGDLDPKRRFASMHVVGPDGRRSSAGLALLRILEAIPFAGEPARLLQNRGLGRDVAKRVYAILVRVRDALAS